TTADPYTVVDGTVGLASSATTFDLASITQGNINYLGLELDGLSGSFVGIDSVTLSLTKGQVLYNSVSGGAPPQTKLNWAGLTAGVLPFTFDSALTRSIDFKLAGKATIDIAGIVSGSTGFSLTKQAVDVTTPALTGATLLVITLTSPTLTVGTGSFGLSFGGPAATITIASLAPAIPAAPATPDGRSWTGIQASGMAGSLTLGTIASATLAGVSFSLNTAAGTSATGTLATPIDWTTVPGSGLTLTGATALEVSGSLTNLSVAGFLAGSADFRVVRQTSDATTSTGATVTGGDLILLQLSNLFLRVGTASVGVTISSGNLSLAAFSGTLMGAASPAPTYSWVALDAENVAATLAVPGITAGVQNLTVKLNQASAGADPLNWTTVTSPPAGLPTFTGAELSAAGELVNLNILGLLTGAARFAISKQTVAANVDGTAGFSPTTDLQGASLVTLWLGLGDTTTDPTNAYYLRVGVPGFGIQIDNGSLFVAALAPAATTDSRRWVGVEASGLGAALAVPLVSGTISNVNVALNKASGVGATVLDWTKDIGTWNATTSTFTPIAVSVLDSGGVAHTIDLTNGTFAVSGQIDNLSIAGLVTAAHAEFALTQSSISLDTNGDGIADISGASLLTFALTNVDLNVGDTSGVHLSVTGANIALAAISSPAAGDTASWLAVQGSLSGASFVGVPGLDLTV
ncbi:MAG TPA: hypothetical protein VJ986_08830, partial [Gaiellaceae bacterium]|nr:hypothetical protein [Gaiellaceae bacterium]